MKNVLIATSEAGTANILVHAVRIISEMSLDHAVLINNNAVRIFEEEGVGFTTPEERGITGIDPESMAAYLLRYKFDCVITGIMGNKADGVDFNIIKAAKKLGIRTISFLDSWCHYSQRLESADGRDKYEYLTDALVLMNRYAHRKLKEELPDIPDDRLSIIGNLYYHNLLKKSGGAGKKSRRKDGPVKIVFLSQPIKEIYGDPASDGYLGYTQYGIIDHVMEGLRGLSDPWELAIRIHPRDSYDGYRKYICSGIKIDRDTNIKKLMLDSDIVLGMSSTSLIDAVLFGKYTGIVQIGMKKGKDLGVLSESGLMRSIQNRQELDRFFEGYFIGTKSAVEFGVDRDKVVRWLELDDDPEKGLKDLIGGKI